MRQEIFVQSQNPSSVRTIRDHKGRVYPTLAAMCRVWGVSKATYLWRRHQGMSIKDSLTAGQAAPRGGCPSRFRNVGRRAA